MKQASNRMKSKVRSSGSAATRSGISICTDEPFSVSAPKCFVTGYASVSLGQHRPLLVAGLFYPGRNPSHAMRPKNQTVRLGRIKRQHTVDHSSEHGGRSGIFLSVGFDHALRPVALDLRQTGSSVRLVDIDKQVTVQPLHSRLHVVQVLQGETVQIVVGRQINQHRAIYVGSRCRSRSVVALFAGERKKGERQEQQATVHFSHDSFITAECRHAHPRSGIPGSSGKAVSSANIRKSFQGRGRKAVTTNDRLLRHRKGLLRTRRNLPARSRLLLGAIRRRE